jgi:RNA polymerase sigma-70 factor (ECF subfamily)
MNPAVLLDDDLTVIERVRTGDTSAFAIIVRRYNQRLYRACRAILRDDSEAEDAVQAAWIKAYRHLDSFRGDAQLTTWLTRIAIREAQDRARKQKPLVALDNQVQVTDHDANPDRAAFAAELGRLFEKRLDELPDGLRSVLLLRDVLELDTRETADCLKITEEAVRVRLHRARQALADLIGTGLAETWRFDGERCDRIVMAVLAAIR